MYTLKSRIRYSELGQDGALTLNGIVNYFQDCSTFQSEDIGMGLKVLAAKKKAWMLSAWQIHIGRYPVLGEVVTVGTGAYDFNTMYGFRNFMMQDESGEYIVKANSQWFLFDLTAMRPCKITQEDLCRYEIIKPLEMEQYQRKIPLPKEYTELEGFSVIRSQIDTNHHVNNGQYIQMAQECVPEGFKASRVRVEYKKAAVLGDVLIPRLSAVDHGYTVALCDSEGSVYAAVELLE